MAEPLVDDIDCFAAVEFRGELLNLFTDDLADAAELLVTIGVRTFAFKDHFAAFKHGAFGDQHDGVAAGLFAAGGNKKDPSLADIGSVVRYEPGIGRGSRCVP